jgi:hypothetical protein
MGNYFNEEKFGWEKLEEMKQSIRNKMDMVLFGHLKQGHKSYEYKRLITVVGGDSIIENEPYLIDQIELTALMENQGIEDEIEEISQEFILLQTAALYSFMCPILSLMVFIFNASTMRVKRYVHLNCMVRQNILDTFDLSTYNQMLEYLNMATILLNCIFMFWFRDNFIVLVRDYLAGLIFMFPDSVDPLGGQSAKGFISGTIGAATKAAKIREVTNSDMFNFFVLVVLFEHLFFLLRYMMSELISDVPSWVAKREIRVYAEIEEMTHSQKELRQQKQRAQYKENIRK